MLRLLSLILFACACATSAWADCAGSNCQKADPEYAKGQPKSFQIESGADVLTIPYVKVGKKAVFEGDIVIGDADNIDFASQAGPIKVLAPNNEPTPFGLVAKSVLFGGSKWTNSTVPYAIDPQLPDPGDILTAMQKWSEKTKIKFVARTPENSSQYKNYVYFTVGTDPNACYSDGLGMMGGKQDVELVDGCMLGQIMHEIGHVLGLAHEQNRSDRDNYVKIETSNIIPGYAGQFSPRPKAQQDVGPYDFDSIMHYEAGAFSNDGEATIVPLVPLPAGTTIGQRDHISEGDAAVINKIYK